MDQLRSAEVFDTYPSTYLGSTFHLELRVDFDCGFFEWISTPRYFSTFFRLWPRSQGLKIRHKFRSVLRRPHDKKSAKGPKLQKESENEFPGPLGFGGPKSPKWSRKRVNIV